MKPAQSKNKGWNFTRSLKQAYGFHQLLLQESYYRGSIGFLLYTMFMSQGGQGGRNVDELRWAVRQIRRNKTWKYASPDVAGAEEENKNCRSGGIPKDPRKFTGAWCSYSAGVLLEGPPGTGKKPFLRKPIPPVKQTPVFSISGSEFVEMFVGVGASRVPWLIWKREEKRSSNYLYRANRAVGLSTWCRGVGGRGVNKH